MIEVHLKKIKKRDGRIVDFDPFRIRYAIERAMISVGRYDEELLDKITNYVLSVLNKKFSPEDIPHVEQIQDIIEFSLVKFDLYDVAKAYITYRKEKEKIRKEKINLLGKFYEEEVAKRFSLNAIRLMVNRYLLKNEKGEIIEGPKQMFQRVAMLVVIPDILYDPLVFDKEGKQKIHPKEDFNPEEWEGKVGLGKKESGYEVTWNKYHLERMKALYDELNEQGKMRVSWSEFWKMLLEGKFEKYYENYLTYYKLMIDKKFLPNSPTLFNAGARLGQLSACFVIDIDDNMESIMEAAKECALIFKSGGGVGINYSKLRPKGDVVASTGGIASGPVSFMRIIDTVTDVVKQGGKRRGANMGILEVWHPDIEEFIHAKEKEGQFENFNISVMITPDFWEYYENNKEYPLRNPRDGSVWKTVNPRRLFEDIAYMAWKTADPGVLFMDNINKRNPMLKYRGPIRATNPCVVGDTRVLTPMGFMKIEDLFKLEKRIKADILFTFNINEGGENIAYATTLIIPEEEEIVYTNTKGKSISYSKPEIKNAYVWKVGYKPVYKIIFEEGLEIEATRDHRFLTKEGWKRVLDLKPKDKVKVARIDIDRIEYYGLKEYKGIKLTYELGFLIGWIIGDGYVQEDAINLYFNKKTEKYVVRRISKYLEKEFGYIPNTYVRKGEIWLRIRKKEIVNLLRELLCGKDLPEIIYIANSEFVKGFLSGLFSADGYVDNDGAIRLTSSNLKLLKEVQKVLLLFGILSKIYPRPYKRKFKYVTKEGEIKIYTSKGYYELIIKNYSRKVFAEKIRLIGHKHKKLIERLNRVKVDNGYFSVKTIEYVGEKIVYDLTVPEDHIYVSNGLISHNCGEQPLYPYESCNLGSINLYAFVKRRNGETYFDWDEYRETIKLAYRFLDNIIDVNKYPLKKIEEASKAVRRVGLGFMGLADTLFALRIPYNSEEGFEFIRKVSEWLTYYAMLESVERAKERGVFPLYDKSSYPDEMPVEGYYNKELWTLDWEYLKEQIRKYGIRNVEVTTIAPTGSLSMLFDVSPGIEPQFALAYVKRVVAGEYKYLDIEFERQLKERGLYNDEILSKITENGGSVQGLNEIPEDMRKVFVTALDIPWWDHVRAQAVAQLWITNSISKTINMPEWVEPEDILKAYLLAYKTGCKGITIYREGSKSKQVIYLPGEVSKKRIAEVLKLIKNKTIDIMQKMGIEPPKWYYELLKDPEDIPKVSLDIKIDKKKVDTCPNCGSENIVYQSGCMHCIDCGWSSCIIA